MYSLFTVYKQSAIFKTNTINCKHTKPNNIIFMVVVHPEYFDLPRPSSEEFYVTRRNGIG